MCQFRWVHFHLDDPPLQSGSTHFENPLFKSGSREWPRGHFSLPFCSGFSPCLSFGEVVGRPTVKIGVKPTPKPTFWQWVDPPAEEGHFEQANIQPKGSSSSGWPIFWGQMNLSQFSLARDPFKHVREEVPTHFPRVGRISGCVKKLCIPQTSRLWVDELKHKDWQKKEKLEKLYLHKRRTT